jgi:hypothetical protein
MGLRGRGGAAMPLASGKATSDAHLEDLATTRLNPFSHPCRAREVLP